jgi:2-polyprenyl-3-methyl-5-hydroxy-6-metoxy-1,4-benzoquinol methylase
MATARTSDNLSWISLPIWGGKVSQTLCIRNQRKKEDRILDTGCGTGDILNSLPQDNYVDTI